MAWMRLSWHRRALGEILNHHYRRTKVTRESQPTHRSLVCLDISSHLTRKLLWGRGSSNLSWYSNSITILRSNNSLSLRIKVWLEELDHKVQCLLTLPIDFSSKWIASLETIPCILSATMGAIWINSTIETTLSMLLNHQAYHTEVCLW